MMIWLHTSQGSPPQHIGSTDGLSANADLIKGAHRARHTTVKICVTAIKGNDVKILMFDRIELAESHMQRNGDYSYTDIAEA
jgi:hypothetical protein